MDVETEAILDLPSSSSAKIRLLRHQRLWTQVDLAKQAKLTLRTIWSLENPVRYDSIPRMKTRRQVLLAFKIPPSQHRRLWPEG